MPGCFFVISQVRKYRFYVGTLSSYSKTLMKKILTILVTLAVAGIAICVWYAGLAQPLGERFACSYRPFAEVDNGMSAAQVVRVLGEPDEKVVKEKLEEYRFGQGDLELRIKSGWLYNLPDWDGGLEIYFDAQEKVVGKGCGNG